jgi:DNA polymerase kappa
MAIVFRDCSRFHVMAFRLPFLSAVGGNSMLTTANYLARKFGVRSAMPGYIAKQLCPELVLVKPRFAAYKKAR